MDAMISTVTVAVICISVAIAWMSFWSTWREKWEDRNRKKLRAIKKLIEELDLVKLWAGTEYDERSHNDDWYNPNWRVNPIPAEQIRGFNWAEDYHLYGDEIYQLLSQLVASLQHLNQIRNEHINYIHSKQQPFVQNIINKLYDEISKREVSKLNPTTITGNNALTEDEIAFVKGLYTVLKRIHTEGIGTSKDSESLHYRFEATYKYVTEYLERIRKQRVPLWSKLGYAFATIFGLVGLGFLIVFVYSLITIVH